VGFAGERPESVHRTRTEYLLWVTIRLFWILLCGIDGNFHKPLPGSFGSISKGILHGFKQLPATSK